MNAESRFALRDAARQHYYIGDGDGEACGVGCA
jgi:hypothetical protein